MYLHIYLVLNCNTPRFSHNAATDARNLAFFRMSLPPELQTLCRRLDTTDPADLPTLCPSLVGHIQRCESVLSLAVDQKPKDGAPEHAVLVHKLKSQITSLLRNGRSKPARFSAAVLIKAVVDVGGYECLRTAGERGWVQGLLDILKVCLFTTSRLLEFAD